MEMSASRVSLSLAVLIAVISCVDSMNYLAFPRMGGKRSSNFLAFTRMGGKRSSTYLAFPRMGRSVDLIEKRSSGLPNNFIVPRKRNFPKGFFVPRKRGTLAFPRMGRSGVKATGETGCCAVGVREEFVLGQDGKDEMRTHCGSEQCCEGLREIIDEKPSGVAFSLCVPDVPLATSEGPSPVLNKLKSLLEN